MAPSGAGYVISAPYWNPSGPALNKKKPKMKEKISSKA